ncbi:putative methyltransferase NSUN7 [Triplophysa dalaica]|uniref:putative methyltransferase NSUN7 n=1 Tax=Triplophysa dalaica TaxID=1582913 RepID=UPI0024DF532B|nr:putative methyltransferase NSUN7 [Triplophysa dalaica]
MKMNLFRFEASGDSNGCFLALLTRQPEAEATETPHDVLARAAAKGLLHDVLPNQPIKRHGCGRRSRRAPVKQRHSKQTRPHPSQSDQSRLEEFIHREMSGDSHLNSSGSSHPSQNNSAGSQRPAQGVFSRTGPAPSPTSFSTSSQRSLKHPGVASVSFSVTPLKGRQEVLRLATITFPPVIFPKNVLPSVRRRHALPALRSDPGHTYLQCSIGPRPSTLPQSLFRASLHHV